MSELDQIIGQAASVEAKPTLKAVKADPGGVKKRAKTKEALQLIKKAVEPRNSQVVSEAYSNLEGALGGRQNLIEVLKFCPESSSAHRAIQKLLIDEALGDVNIAISALCRKNRVRFESLALAFRDSISAKVAVEALTRLSANAPEVFDQLAIQATNRYDVCPVCEGTARVRRIGENGEWALNAEGVPITQLCYQCRGTGKVFKEHEVQDRKLYLEILGVMPEKSRGPLVQFNQNAILGKDFQPGDGSFERLVKAIDRAVAGKAETSDDVIDSEFVVFDKNPVDPV